MTRASLLTRIRELETAFTKLECDVGIRWSRQWRDTLLDTRRSVDVDQIAEAERLAVRMVRRRVLHGVAAALPECAA
ncbi:MAG: hypothetical protein V4657_03870 [Pseudomonadota bacterium]